MNQKLINRLARIQGQIETLKKSIGESNQKPENCKQNLILLKAAINGLKKFGAAYMIDNLDKCLEKKQNQKELIQTAIQTGFDI